MDKRRTHTCISEAIRRELLARIGKQTTYVINIFTLNARTKTTLQIGVYGYYMFPPFFVKPKRSCANVQYVTK